MPICKYASPNSFRDIDDDKIVHPVAVSEPDFRQRTRIGHVVSNNGKAGGLLNTRLELSDWPVHVWCKDGLLKVRIKAAGKIDANALEGPLRMRPKHLLHGIQNYGNHVFWIGGQVHGIVRNDFAYQ